MAYRILGKALPRIEGYGKVTGQTKYAADLEFPGLVKIQGQVLNLAGDSFWAVT